MNNANILKPALTGGVAIGILSALPVLNICNICCAWAIAGGVLAAYLHIKESPFQVTMGRGAGVGLAAGGIGAVVLNLFSIPLQRITRSGINEEQMMEQMRERMREQLSRNPDIPAELIQFMEALFMRSDFMVMVNIVIFFGSIALFSLFAMLGGVIGVAIFEKRKPGDASPDMLPPTDPVDTPPSTFP